MVSPIAIALSARVSTFFPYLEWPLVGVAFLGLYLVLAKYALGGPLSTDILGYMNAGLHNTPSAYVLNRYFHILLEKVFLEIAPNPLIGVQHYWAWLVAGTTLLIYIGARRFTERSTPIHGILAAGIFFSLPPIAESAGIAFVDTTAMFMVALLVVIYILSVRKAHKAPWLIMAWGCVLYLAFKTKETTLAAWVLLPGFGIYDNKWHIRTFLKNICFVLLGFLIGILIFAVWNSVVFGDFFFGLRLSDIQKFLTTYVRNAQEASPIGTDNWYTYLFANLSVLFLFYLISSLKTPKVELCLRLVWLIPLVLIGFLTATVNNQWGLQYRLFMPALPALAIVSPQFLALRGSSVQETVRLAVALLLGFVAIIVFRAYLRAMAPQWGWNIVVLMAVVVEPLILTLFLATSLVADTLSIKASGLAVVLLIALLITPLRRNYKIMFVQRPNWEKSQQMFYPFAAFEKELQYVSPMRIYIPLSVWHGTGLGGLLKNLDEVICAYNVYFDAHAIRTDFYVTPSRNPKTFLQDIFGANYTHILLRRRDWLSIQTILEDDPQAKAWLEQRYEVILEPKNLLVLLKARSR